MGFWTTFVVTYLVLELIAWNIFGITPLMIAYFWVTGRFEGALLGDLLVIPMFIAPVMLAISWVVASLGKR